MTAIVPVKFYLPDIRSVKWIAIWLVAITVRRKIDSCPLILTEESYINKESEKQLRSRYDQFISSVPISVAVVSSQFDRR